MVYTWTESWTDQYVEVTNVSSVSVNVSNWMLTAASSNRTYYFPNGLVMQAGEKCRIPAVSSVNDSCGSYSGPLSFNSPTQVWSTTGDIARLYNAANELIDTYAYTSP